MPSKGVQVYAFIAVSGCSVEFSVPGRTLTKSDMNAWSNNHLEVDKRNIHGLFNFVGQFGFKVTQNGATLCSRWVEINSLTGNLVRGNMKAMEDQTSLVLENTIVTYGLYDAGTGKAGLPNASQCYVTVTPNQANWMATTAIPGSDKAAKPFSRLVLPSAHDVGMNSMQSTDAMIQRIGDPFVNVLKNCDSVFAQFADKMSQSVIDAIAPNVISGLAITQKDDLNTMLTIGARYFEFRPAYLHDAIRRMSPLEDQPYFLHGPIPGMAYAEFLEVVVSFLLEHPSEIVVVQLRWDGVPKECARPSDETLNDLLRTALAPTSGALISGSFDDMKKSTIDQLRNSRKRLIMLRNVDSLSTWDEKANATLDGDSIIQEFDKLSTERQKGKAFTNLQCQATATNIKDVVIYSVMTANVSNSCLLATKPVCDTKTLPWIQRNALQKLQDNQLLVIMNDFFDGATAWNAIDLSKKRLAQ